MDNFEIIYQLKQQIKDWCL